MIPSRSIAPLLVLALAAQLVAAPADPKPEVAPPPREKLDLAPLVRSPNEAVPVVGRYDVDRGALLRTFTVSVAPSRVARITKFDGDWLAALKAIDFATVSPAAREELLKLRERVEANLKETETRAAEFAAVAPLLPFAQTIIDLEEARRRMEPIDAEKAAGKLDAMRKQLAALRATVDANLKKGKAMSGLPATKAAANQAAMATAALQAALARWHGFYDGYDPLFSWWAAAPYKQVDAALADYAALLNARAQTLPDGDPKVPTASSLGRADGPTDAPDLAALLAAPRSELAAVLARYRPDRNGRPDPIRWLEALNRVPFEPLSRTAKVDYLLFKTRLQAEVKRAELRANPGERPAVPRDDTGIVGRPIGRDAMLAELAAEMIPYTPEELVAIARKELEWCDAETLKASREMGYGDDWKAATEKVKTRHVGPGGQPKLIRELSDEAVAFLKKHDLVTVPPLAEETWRMEMMTPERQLVNPFFTGGEVISVSFPTNAMAHEAKLQSLRGNNIHFSRATVQHELIPGHHLQQFMNLRYQPQRSPFGTAFWTEGWALYWEFVLYSKVFPRTPEDRIGFLTWRKHRCCRIIFSLGYHLGTMTPRQCVDLLVGRVGFEPENAMGEVRRSFTANYGPLYQAAYMLGGKQFWALRQELVASGKMTERAFHDAVLAEHAMPVAMVRAVLTGQKLTAEGLPPWRFADK